MQSYGDEGAQLSQCLLRETGRVAQIQQYSLWLEHPGRDYPGCTAGTDDHHAVLTTAVRATPTNSDYFPVIRVVPVMDCNLIALL